MSTVATRSSRPHVRVAVLALLAAALTPVSLRAEDAQDDFPALAKKSGVVRLLLRNYEEKRSKTAQGLALLLTTEDVTSDVLASEDPAAAAIESVDRVVDLLEGKLLELQKGVTAQKSSAKKALLEAFKAWSKSERAEIDAARELAGHMAATRARLVVDWQAWELYGVLLRYKLSDVQKLAKALSKAYVRVDELLVTEADAEVLKRERLVFQPITWASRTLEEVLKKLADGVEAEVKKTYPAETHAAAFATLDRLLQGKQFTHAVWVEELAKGKPYLDRLLQKAVDEHQRVIEIAAPISDGSLLAEQGAPFDEVKFEGIRDAFYALYGRLQGRSGG